jgi:type I restriction enzyme S subunit
METYKLRDLCSTEISDGTHQTPTYSETGYIFLSSKNVTTGKIDWNNVMYIPESLHNELYKRIRPQRDDILLAKNGTTGVAAIVDRDEVFDIYVSLALIRPDKSKVLPRYLLYAINSTPSKEFFNSNLKGIGVPNLHLKHIRETPIRVPSFKEQEHIISVLDKVTDLLDHRTQQLAELDELVKSRFIELFGDPMDNPKGWDKVNISAVVGGKVSNGFFAKRDDYCDDGNVKVLGVAHVVNRMYSNTEGLPKTNGTEADIAKYGVKYGDMLFCRSSLVAAGIGKASIVPKNVPSNVLFECHVIRLPLDLTRCVPEFMQVLSTMEYFRSQVIAQSKTATMTTIGQDGILKTDIILPPIEMQNQFLQSIEQINKTKTVVQNSIYELEELKKALMQQYFG